MFTVGKMFIFGNNTQNSVVNMSPGIIIFVTAKLSNFFYESCEF
jgi:hypothetical protein